MITVCCLVQETSFRLDSWRFGFRGLDQTHLQLTSPHRAYVGRNHHLGVIAPALLHRVLRVDVLRHLLEHAPLAIRSDRVHERHHKPHEILHVLILPIILSLASSSYHRFVLAHRLLRAIRHKLRCISPSSPTFMHSPPSKN